MSTKIGIIAEGPIDHALLPPLLSRIAAEKAGITWPLRADDVAELFFLRKRGHGGVLEAVRHLVGAIDTTHFDHACFVILLDRRTQAVQAEVKQLITGRERFVLGIASEEVEAWWLGDRTNTLAWSQLNGKLPAECRYGQSAYKAEADDHPKATLDELTRLSDRFDHYYGDGNLDLALDFAENHWQGYARIDEISAQCPKNYRPFQKDIVNQFRRLNPGMRPRA
ncbi:MAG: hypothetical protein K2R98_28480 [Gemmataceae bacterium]|nr:hypothetical protein [Gemmataceae bacterium]